MVSIDGRSQQPQKQDQNHPQDQSWQQPSPASQPSNVSQTGEPPADDRDIFSAIERLGKLHANGLLTDDEFSQKKAELLSRL